MQKFRENKFSRISRKCKFSKILRELIFANFANVTLIAKKNSHEKKSSRKITRENKYLYKVCSFLFLPIRQPPLFPTLISHRYRNVILLIVCGESIPARLGKCTSSEFRVRTASGKKPLTCISYSYLVIYLFRRNFRADKNLKFLREFIFAHLPQNIKIWYYFSRNFAQKLC